MATTLEPRRLHMGCGEPLKPAQPALRPRLRPTHRMSHGLRLPRPRGGVR